MLALLGLWLQLAAAALYLPLADPVPSRDQTDLARLYGAHALCITADAAGGPGSSAPTEPAPATPVHHLGACCPGYGSLSPCLPPPAAVAPVVFAGGVPCFPVAAPVAVAARLPGICRARAPPIDA